MYPLDYKTESVLEKTFGKLNERQGRGCLFRETRPAWCGFYPDKSNVAETKKVAYTLGIKERIELDHCAMFFS